ncbi:ArnT family glycosyltransferase [Capillimicrobium parvum]|uniref:ArnT family glycosyltransferase n=1 Tax=Capillimicrobium parvum TaxID=2884022 RepID=UPI00216B5451|nr:glycosyltransferase family 39 protein [Capillimicrobium parvum]
MRHTVTPFTKGLGVIALLALAVRTINAIQHRDFQVLGDAMTFHLVGQGLADGKGFVEAFPPGGPTAEHPPGLEVFLAFWDKLGANGFLAHRIILGAVGTGTVVLIGLLARRVAGDRVGLTAAAIAAVYPMLWLADASLMSETLYGFFLVSALLCALWVRDAPSWRRAAALGALIALAALTRGEALALIVLLAIPVAIASRPTWSSRAALWAATLAAFVLVLAPWTIFNLTRFDSPVLISTNSNGLFVGANCRDTYHGELIGAWRFQCYTKRRANEDEAQYFARQRRIGIDFALDHKGRWPAVVGARLGRLADVYRFDQSVFFNTAEGRPANPVRWGIRMYWVVALLALAGIVLLARRRTFGLVVLLAPIVMVVCVATVTYGGTRFRYAAEPSLVILAAVTLVAAAQRLLASAGAPRTEPAASPPASAPRA